jgi:branched-chain amino acid transport system substrate-binding protein
MRRLAVLLAVGSLLASVGCSKKLLVGVVLPETGDNAVYGAPIKSGTKLAFDQAFADHSAPEGLEVIYRDSGSDPARAVAESEALIDQGAVVIIGGATSAEANALLPVINEHERILISPSASSPALARKSLYFFRVYPSDDLEGVKAADLLYQTRGVKRVLILQEDNTYTRGLLPVFMNAYKSDGGEIVGTVQIGATDWEKDARSLAHTENPDGVYVCGYGDAIVSGLRLLRGMDYKGTICTTSAISTVSVMQKAGELAEGVFFPLASFDTSSDKEPIHSFVKHYYDVYKLVPDIYAAHGYDAALATLYALRGLRTRTGNEIALKLKGLGEKMGVTGPLAFDDYGNIKHYLRNHWIHDGKVEDYDAYLEREKARIRAEFERALMRGGTP